MHKPPNTHEYDCSDGQLLGRAAVVVGCVRRIESMKSSCYDSLCMCSKAMSSLLQLTRLQFHHGLAVQ